MRHKKWAAMYRPGCVWLYWLPGSKWESWTTLAHVLHVLMLTRTKWRRHCWRQWWWRCRLTHIPWQAMVSLINKRVGKTDWVALTSGRYVITGTCTLWQLPVFVHVKLIVYFSFFYKCTTDLDQALVTISWARAPYPCAPCILTTPGTVHAHILWCTKNKNNFLVTFFAITLYHFLHILH